MLLAQFASRKHMMYAKKKHRRPMPPVPLLCRVQHIFSCRKPRTQQTYLFFHYFRENRTPYFEYKWKCQKTPWFFWEFFLKMKSNFVSNEVYVKVFRCLIRMTNVYDSECCAPNEYSFQTNKQTNQVKFISSWEKMRTLQRPFY